MCTLRLRPSPVEVRTPHLHAITHTIISSVTLIYKCKHLTQVSLHLYIYIHTQESTDSHSASNTCKTSCPLLRHPQICTHIPTGGEITTYRQKQPPHLHRHRIQVVTVSVMHTHRHFLVDKGRQGICTATSLKDTNTCSFPGTNPSQWRLPPSVPLHSSHLLLSGRNSELKVSL